MYMYVHKFVLVYMSACLCVHVSEMLCGCIGILHLIQLIVLEYGSGLLLDRREARRLHMVVVSLLMPPCVEKMSGVK